MQINDRLTIERDRLGHTQTVMAKLTGVAFRTYCDYEAGKSEPRASFFVLAASIGLDVPYVLLGERSQSALSVDEQMLIGAYRSLDTRGRAGVLGMVSGLQQPETTIALAFHGEVGQVVDGDLTNTGSLKISVGGRKRSAKSPRKTPKQPQKKDKGQ